MKHKKAKHKKHVHDHKSTQKKTTTLHDKTHTTIKTTRMTVKQKCF